MSQTQRPTSTPVRRAVRPGTVALAMAMASVAALQGEVEAQPPVETPPAEEETSFYEIEEEKRIPRVDLDVDSDRDGTVEDAADDSAEETWTQQRGAVFLNNVDDDDDENDADDTDKVDNRDLTIDGADDRVDLAEIVIRVADRAPEEVVTLRILGQDASKVRIFDETDRPRLGQTGAGVVDAYALPNQGAAFEVTYLVEGLAFPSAAFKYLDLRLELDLGDIGVILVDRVRLRIAPYMLLANTESGEEVYYIDDGADNRAFRQDLERVVPAGARAPYSVGDYEDEWAQDEMEIGYTLHARSRMHVVLDLPRNRPLDPFPEEMLLDPDVGHWELEDLESDLDLLFQTLLAQGDEDLFDDLVDTIFDDFYGGNVEVSFRPVTAQGKRYLFGRALIGSTLQAEVRQFLVDQEVQTPAVELDVNWLKVGHVDEVVTVVPGRSVMVPDTDLAWTALVVAVLNGQGGRVVFENLVGKRGNRLDTRIIDLVSNDPAVRLRMPDGSRRTAREFAAAQRVVQTRLDRNRATLAAGLSLAPQNIIRLPALYTDWSRAAAYLPAAVNGLVIDGKYGCPEQHGPTIVPADGDFLEMVIGDAAAASFGGAGNVSFIDDFSYYHVYLGNVHCGTNVKRMLVAPPPAWWDQVEP